MTEITALAVRQTTIINNMDDAARAAKAMAVSGYFQDAKQAEQALVKILAGREMGFGPFASMNGVYIIQGRPSIGANLMAAAVKGSGRYNYRVIEMTDTKCSIKFYEGKEEIGVSTFTIEDARKAQTKNLDKFPRNMLFARAMSNGVRWYCPDVFSGNTVYTPEELGANVNEEGEVIDATVTTIQPVKTNGKAQEAVIVTELTGEPPADSRPVPFLEACQNLAKMTDLHPDRVKNTLNFCEFANETNITMPQWEAWWNVYKTARNSKLTPQEAGNYANLAAGLKPDLAAAGDFLSAIIAQNNGQ